MHEQTSTALYGCCNIQTLNVKLLSCFTHGFVCVAHKDLMGIIRAVLQNLEQVAAQAAKDSVINGLLL